MQKWNFKPVINIYIFMSLILLGFGLSKGMAQGTNEGKKPKKIIKYKKFERFDLDDLAVDADKDGVGDVSVDQRPKTNFKNRLPSRKNFNPEIKRSVDSVK